MTTAKQDDIDGTEDENRQESPWRTIWRPPDCCAKCPGSVIVDFFSLGSPTLDSAQTRDMNLRISGVAFPVIWQEQQQQQQQQWGVGRIIIIKCEDHLGREVLKLRSGLSLSIEGESYPQQQHISLLIRRIAYKSRILDSSCQDSCSPARPHSPCMPV